MERSFRPPLPAPGPPPARQPHRCVDLSGAPGRRHWHWHSETLSPLLLPRELGSLEPGLRNQVGGTLQSM